MQHTWIGDAAIHCWNKSDVTDARLGFFLLSMYSCNRLRASEGALSVNHLSNASGFSSNNLATSSTSWEVTEAFLVAFSCANCFTEDVGEEVFVVGEKSLKLLLLFIFEVFCRLLSVLILFYFKVITHNSMELPPLLCSFSQNSPFHSKNRNRKHGKRLLLFFYFIKI